MNVSNIITRTNLITSAANFIIAIMLLLVVQWKLVVSWEVGFSMGVLFYIALWLIVIVSRSAKVHSKILGPIRRRLQFALSPIVIDNWKAIIMIDDSENGKIVHDFKGHVNFEQNKWISLGILADEPQQTGSNFPIKVTNVDSGKEVEPQAILDYPEYKRFRILFDKTLVRGDRFHYRVEYNLIGSFYLGKKDRYAQDATHFERKIDIRVEFPRDYIITNVDTDILTAQGDKWLKHRNAEHDDNWIQWTIDDAVMSNRHVLEWKTRKC